MLRASKAWHVQHLHGHASSKMLWLPRLTSRLLLHLRLHLLRRVLVLLRRLRLLLRWQMLLVGLGRSVTLLQMRHGAVLGGMCLHSSAAAASMKCLCA